MPADEAFAGLVRRVGEFHITDRAMKQAQSEAEAQLRGSSVDAKAKKKYLQAVRTYFSGFEKEARSHLRDVDRRLENLNQVQFNLNAERGVAVKRIEATQSVLADLADVESAGA